MGNSSVDRPGRGRQTAGVGRRGSPPWGRSPIARCRLSFVPPRFGPPQGPRRLADGSVEFVVWAPFARQVFLRTFAAAHREPAEGRAGEPADVRDCELAVMREGSGYFHTVLPADACPAGTRYEYRLDEGRLLPDPAARHQPDGVEAPSGVFFPEDFAWTDAAWQGIPHAELVIYEMHIGTFTPEGTFDAAISRLADLVELGVTALELLPLAQCPGDRNWGYDGVHWFAVQNTYGGPAGLQRFTNAAHRYGLAVMLDVVYNHFGPEGNFVGEFGPYLRENRYTPWGAAVNYDREDCGAVRQFVIDNAAMWIREFHLDGLRLDAVQEIRDRSKVHILAEVQTACARAGAERNVPVHLFGETDENDARYFRSQELGGYGLAGVWSDCFHHAVHALLTGERMGFYQDFGEPEQLAKAYERLFVTDGGWNRWRKRKHGTQPTGFSHLHLVHYLQNHDQVGNRPRGDRFGTLLPIAAQRSAAVLLLLSPGTPLLWMGEEYGETAPFPFFCSFRNEALNRDVDAGRRREALEFGYSQDDVDEMLVPADPATFRAAILNWEWPAGTAAAGLRQLVRDLLRLRKSHPGLREPGPPRATLQCLPQVDGPAAGLPPERPNVLLVERGRAAPLCFAMNFTDRPATAPAAALAGTLLLRTGSPRYGGEPHEPAAELLPHEAWIWEP